MKERIRVYPSPDGIRRSDYPDSFARQGTDAFSAYETGLAISSDWMAAANGIEVPVYATPVTRGGPHSFCSVDFPKVNTQVRFKLKFNGFIISAAILPEHLAVPFSIDGNTIIFTVFNPCNLLLEINDQYKTPLTISVNPPLEDVPPLNDPNVIWFKAGLHEIDRIDLKDNQIVYLEGGAVIKAKSADKSEGKLVECDWAGKPNYKDFFSAENVKSVKIIGRGIIDTSELDWHERRSVFFDGCSNVEISGITFIGAAHWTILCKKCRNVKIDNCKLYGYRENSDGIDIVNSENVEVRNCFIRTGDDAVCIKSMLPPPETGGKNITVEKCMVWNDKVRCFGIAGETMSNIADVTFRDCDIVRSFADWTREVGSLCIITCDSGTISNILFENIRIRHEVNYAINCMIMHDRWSTDRQVGRIRDITFKHIEAPLNVPSQFWGYDDEHLIENVKLEGLCVYGNGNKISDERLIQKNGFTKNIRYISERPTLERCK